MVKSNCPSIATELNLTNEKRKEKGINVAEGRASARSLEIKFGRIEYFR